MRTFKECLLEFERKLLGGVLPIASRQEKRQLHARIHSRTEVVHVPILLPHDSKDPTPQAATVPIRFVDYKYKEEVVPKHKIIATQRYLDKNIVQNYQKKSNKGEDPAMWKFKGKYFMMDGHHRTISRLLKGSKGIRSIVYDIDEGNE